MKAAEIKEELAMFEHRRSFIFTLRAWDPRRADHERRYFRDVLVFLNGLTLRQLVKHDVRQLIADSGWKNYTSNSGSF